ncbi:MAG: hypothetical protein ACPGJV_10435 [Bacteriovoracaceae bacterium]
MQLKNSNLHRICLIGLLTFLSGALSAEESLFLPERVGRAVDEPIVVEEDLDAEYQEYLNTHKQDELDPEDFISTKSAAPVRAENVQKVQVTLPKSTLRRQVVKKTGIQIDFGTGKIVHNGREFFESETDLYILKFGYEIEAYKQLTSTAQLSLYYGDQESNRGVQAYTQEVPDSSSIKQRTILLEQSLNYYIPIRSLSLAIVPQVALGLGASDLTDTYSDADSIGVLEEEARYRYSFYSMRTGLSFEHKSGMNVRLSYSRWRSFGETLVTQEFNDNVLGNEFETSNSKTSKEVIKSEIATLMLGYQF